MAERQSGLIGLLSAFAHRPEDSEALRLEKIAALIIAGSCCLAGLLWTVMYALIFGWTLTTALPMLFMLLVGGALVVAHITGRHLIAVTTQILCIIYITAAIQWSIGGLYDSGFVLVWSILGPLTALVFFSLRRSALWFALFLINLLVTVIFDGVFSSRVLPVSLATQRLFFAMNLGIASLVVFIFSGYFVRSAVDQRERAERLLANVLPASIARILKNQPGTLADSAESATVLFADIVGSTPLFAELPAVEVVDWLNQVVSVLDDLAEQYGLEKIRTIGDNYMAVAGVPEQRADHAHCVARFALHLLEVVEAMPARAGRRLQFRVGINSGPLVAGVIGKSKFHYDVWGDMVNVASRMESHGEPGRIHITAATYTLLKDEFVCEPRGMIEVKGKGAMQTYWLLGER